MQRGRLVIYIAAAPGAGKTRRLLSDARRMALAGKRVSIAAIDTRGNEDLERLAQEVPAVPNIREADVVVIDDLEAPGPDGRLRWETVKELLDANISILAAVDIEHVAMNATVPLSLLQSADEVIAIDASPSLLRERAGAQALDETRLIALREALLRTIDALTIPSVEPAAASTAVAVMDDDQDDSFISRAAPIAAALDLALELLPSFKADTPALRDLAAKHDAVVLPGVDVEHHDLDQLRASMLALPSGKLAARTVNQPVRREIAIIDASQSYLAQSAFTTPLSGTLGDRMRVGYGKLTVYLGPATGAGKTYTMLDRGQHLRRSGVDAIIGLVNVEGRPETAAMIGDTPVVERKNDEMDRDAVLARRPQAVLVDELAHTNAPGSPAPKRFHDVLAFLRAGIDVYTTLNVYALEALADVVARLTGTTVKETLPDGILPLADEVILVDASPDTLRERLIAGKIFPQERIERALGTFFKAETLASLRELAIREALRAETRERIAAPFGHLLLSVVARPDDLLLVRKASRLAARLEVDFSIAHIAEKRDKVDPAVLDDFVRAANSVNAEWIDERVSDAALRVIELARTRKETVVAVGGTHRTPRWPQRNSFARRLLDAGAKELIVLARPGAISETQLEDT